MVRSVAFAATLTLVVVSAVVSCSSTGDEPSVLVDAGASDVDASDADASDADADGRADRSYPYEGDDSGWLDTRTDSGPPRRSCPGVCVRGDAGAEYCDFNAVCVVQPDADAALCSFGVDEFEPCGCFGCGAGCTCTDSVQGVCSCP